MNELPPSAVILSCKNGRNLAGKVEKPSLVRVIVERHIDTNSNSELKSNET
jgi:hypothetical protein